MKKKDPTSHRIIEKRRRDRMNNCLADLSKLIPAHYMKKGRGRIEKTEIIEMAIKHLRDVLGHSNAQQHHQQDQNATPTTTSATVAESASHSQHQQAQPCPPLQQQQNQNQVQPQAMLQAGSDPQSHNHICHQRKKSQNFESNNYHNDNHIRTQIKSDQSDTQMMMMNCATTTTNTPQHRTSKPVQPVDPVSSTSAQVIPNQDLIPSINNNTNNNNMSMNDHYKSITTREVPSDGLASYQSSSDDSQMFTNLSRNHHGSCSNKSTPSPTNSTGSESPGSGGMNGSGSGSTSDSSSSSSSLCTSTSTSSFTGSINGASGSGTGSGSSNFDGPVRCTCGRIMVSTKDENVQNESQYSSDYTNNGSQSTSAWYKKAWLVRSFSHPP